MRSKTFNFNIWTKLLYQVAFCDVTGRESRLPLTICGDGLGPAVSLSLDSLDIGQLVKATSHIYEVIVSNRSLIAANCTVLLPDTAFGKSFTIAPVDFILDVDSCQVLTVKFVADRIGCFEEVISVQVDGITKCELFTFRYVYITNVI